MKIKTRWNSSEAKAVAYIQFASAWEFKRKYPQAIELAKKQLVEEFGLPTRSGAKHTFKIKHVSNTRTRVTLEYEFP